MYYEGMHSAQWPQPSTTPTGVAVFSEDVADPALRRAEQQNRALVGFDRGGRVAAMEAPDLLVSDVRAFFRRFR
jgi:hypothetical protein